MLLEIQQPAVRVEVHCTCHGPAAAKPIIMHGANHQHRMIYFFGKEGEHSQIRRHVTGTPSVEIARRSSRKQARKQRVKFTFVISSPYGKISLPTSKHKTLPDHLALLQYPLDVGLETRFGPFLGRGRA